VIDPEKVERLLPEVEAQRLPVGAEIS